MASTSSSAGAADSSGTKKPVSVLFVCLGNICRSPMAEAVFQHHSASSPHIPIRRIDSCGTAAYHTGSAPDSRTLAVLSKHRTATGYKHRARKVQAEDFTEFDYIFGMDADNVADLKRLRSKVLSQRKQTVDDGDQEGIAEVSFFGDYGGKRKAEEVVDPYYGADDGFEVAFEQMVRFSKGFLAFLEEGRPGGGTSSKV